MEKCKFCEAELEEGVTLCPGCGKDNAGDQAPAEEVAEIAETEAAVTEVAEAETAEAETAETEAAAETAPAQEQPAAEIVAGVKVTPVKMVLAVVGIIVLVALIVALLVGGVAGKNEPDYTVPTETVEEVAAETTAPPTVPADTGANDATCKGSYSVSDEEAIAGADTVVATVGGAPLTNAQLQMYYWSYVSNYLNSEYGYQFMMYGMLDLSQPLDSQACLVEEGLTWQQYFLKCSLQNWQSIQAMALEAEANGYELSAEIQALLDEIPAQLEETAKQYGAESVEQLLAQNMGAGVGLDDFLGYQKVYYQGAPYYTEATAAFTVTVILIGIALNGVVFEGYICKYSLTC